MLRKLIKYEFKATARSYIPLYATIIVSSLLVNLQISFLKNEFLMGLSVFILFALFVTLGVITLMTIIQRFKNNLLSDEGYLMFTLPVSTEKLILSKLITALAWVAASSVVSLLSFIIIMANRKFDLLGEISRLIKNYSYFLEILEFKHLLLAGSFFLCVVFQLVYFILLVYTSLSVGQVPAFNKHRGLYSFIAFIGATIVVNSTIELSFKNIFTSISFASVENITLIFSAALLINISLSVLAFFAADYLLKKHLNIE